MLFSQMLNIGVLLCRRYDRTVLIMIKAECCFFLIAEFETIISIIDMTHHDLLTLDRDYRI